MTKHILLDIVTLKQKNTDITTLLNTAQEWDNVTEKNPTPKTTDPIISISVNEKYALITVTHNNKEMIYNQQTESFETITNDPLIFFTKEYKQFVQKYSC